MKKIYAALIITIMAFNPVLAFATGNEEIDDPPALDNIELSQPAEVPTEPSVTPDEIASSPTDSNAQPQATTPEPPSVPDKSTEDKLENEPTPDNNNTDDLINAPTLNEGDNDDPYNAPVVENELDDTSTLKSEKEVEATSKDDNKDKSPDDKTIIEHEHEFTYEYLGDGTHIKKCTKLLDNTATNESADSSSENPTEEGGSEDVNVDTPNTTEPAATHCDFEIIEPCTFNEEGFCLYCKAEKPKEKEEFNPSISFSISNQSFTTGGPNPVISVSISQEDYDIAYAQVCFANYGANKYINVGLAQGKYFDFQSEEFVDTSNDCWCASCDITSDYASGNYSLRSIYVRSTTGESIHYSIESDSLPEEYQNVEISLDMDVPETTNQELIEESLIHEPLIDNTANADIIEPAIIEPIGEEPLIEETTKERHIEETPHEETTNVPKADAATSSIPKADETTHVATPSVPKATEPTPASDKQESSKQDLSNKVEIPEPAKEENNLESKVSKEPINDDKDSANVIKDSINSSIAIEENSIEVESNLTKQQPSEKKTPSQDNKVKANTENEPSGIFSIFNSLLDFMKNLFKWW